MPSLPCAPHDPMFEVSSLFDSNYCHVADPMIQVETLFGASSVSVPCQVTPSASSSSCVMNTQRSLPLDVDGLAVDLHDTFVSKDMDSTDTSRRRSTKTVYSSSFLKNQK